MSKTITIIAGFLLYSHFLYSQNKVVKSYSSSDVNTALENKIFINAQQQDGKFCKLVLRESLAGLYKLDANLETILKRLQTSIQKLSLKELHPLFHTGMKIKYSKLETVFKKIRSIYMVPINVSAFRIWAIKNSDGRSNIAINCPSDSVSIYPLSRFPQQFSVWLQLMGERELGKVFITLVPENGVWKIGAFEVTQWTHNGQDFSYWLEQADKLKNKDNKIAAWLHYDIAAKLLNAGAFMDIGIQESILKARDYVMTEPEFQMYFKKMLKNYEVAYSSSLLAVDGAGILIRLRVKKEVSSADMQEQSKAITNIISKLNLDKSIKGVRVNYILPLENKHKEGILGGMYVPLVETKVKTKI